MGKNLPRTSRTVAITVADNQELIAQELNKKGYIYLVGNACKESIDQITDKLDEFSKSSHLN